MPDGPEDMDRLLRRYVAQRDQVAAEAGQQHPLRTDELLAKPQGAPDPSGEMDRVLRGYVQRRDELAASVPKLHPADIRLLLAQSQTSQATVREPGSWPESLRMLWHRLLTPGWALGTVAALLVISAIVLTLPSRSPVTLAKRNSGVRQFAMLTDGAAVRGSPTTTAAEAFREFNLRVDFDNRQVTLQFGGGLILSGRSTLSRPAATGEARPYSIKASGRDSQNRPIDFEGELILGPAGAATTQPGTADKATLRGELTLADGKKLPLAAGSK